MLLAQEYVPDLSEYKDKFMRTPLGLLTQGNVSGAVDRLGSDAMLRVDAMSNPEAALQTGMDFMGGGLLGTTKLVNKTQMELANEIASKNAETMLGLPKGNTAMDRAKAMGFDVENTMYHGTNRDFTSFNPNQSTRISQMYGGEGDIGRGATYMSDNPELANRYSASVFKSGSEHPVSEINGVKVTYENGRVIPLYKKGNLFDSNNPDHVKKINDVLKKPEWKWHNNSFINGSWDEMEKPHVQKIIKDAGFDGYIAKETTPITREKGQSNAIFNPTNIRSVNAAFDPAKANESDILAGMIALPVGSLLQEPEKNK